MVQERRSVRAVSTMLRVSSEAWARASERVSYGPMLEMFGRNERHGWDCWGSGEPPQRALALEVLSA